MCWARGRHVACLQRTSTINGCPSTSPPSLPPPSCDRLSPFPPASFPPLAGGELYCFVQVCVYCTFQWGRGL